MDIKDKLVYLYIANTDTTITLENARQFITIDIITRILKNYFNYSIMYSTNTKLDLNQLCIEKPSYIISNVSVIEHIQKLIDNNFAYIDEYGIYFDIDEYETGVDYVHIDNNILWEFTNEEPCFESPWGYGRPSLYIESAAACPNNVHIYSGSDNIIGFNSVLLDEKWAEIKLNVEKIKTKMNFNDFIEKYNINILRLLCILNNWDSKITNLNESCDHAIKFNNTLNEFMIIIQNYIYVYRNYPVKTNKDILSNLEIASRAINEAFSTFNTNKVSKELLKIINLTHDYINSEKIPDSVTLNCIFKFMKKILLVFGIGIHEITFTKTQEDYDNLLNDTIDVRNQIISIFKNSDYSVSDKLNNLWDISETIRNKLKKYNLRLIDEQKLNVLRL